MVSKEQVIQELNLRIFDESYKRIEICLQFIDEHDVWQSPNKNIPSIGNIILHLCGNVRQWLLAGLDSQKDIRNRPKEFNQTSSLKKDELLELMYELKEDVTFFTKKMKDELLNENFTIQDFSVTGYSAVSHVIEHFSYHTGQITILTKLCKNVNTEYYDDDELNK